MKHVCVGLTATLVLALAALFWVSVAWKCINRGAVKGTPAVARQGQREVTPPAGVEGEHNQDDVEATGTGSTNSGDMDVKLKKQVSTVSFRSLKSLDNMELQPKLL